MEEKAQSFISSWGRSLGLGMVSLVALGTGIAYYNYSTMQKQGRILEEIYAKLIGEINAEYARGRRLSKDLVEKMQKAMILRIRETYLEHVLNCREARRKHLVGSQSHSDASQGSLTMSEKDHLEKYVQCSLKEFNTLFGIYEEGIRLVIGDCEAMKNSLVSSSQIMAVIFKIDEEMATSGPGNSRRSLNQMITELRMEEWSVDKFGSNKVHKGLIEDVKNFCRILLFRNKLFKRVDLRGVDQGVYVVIKKKIVSDILACETGIESEDLAYAYMLGLNNNGSLFRDDKVVTTLNREYDLLILNDRMMNTSQKMAEDFIGKMKKNGINPEELVQTIATGRKVENQLKKN